MVSQLYSFAVGFVSFIFYGGVFLLLVRSQTRAGWVALQAITGVVIHLLSSILSFYFIDGFLYWYALGVFSVCWFLFFTLSTAIYVSISARILRTIFHQPTQSISLEDIFTVCIRKPFQQRAEFLVASGLAQKGKVGFRITDFGEKQAGRIQALRQIFGMEGSGLYSVDGSIQQMEMRVKK